jgi:hypothetical protein
LTEFFEKENNEEDFPNEVQNILMVLVELKIKDIEFDVSEDFKKKLSQNLKDLYEDSKGMKQVYPDGIFLFITKRR